MPQGWAPGGVLLAMNGPFEVGKSQSTHGGAWELCPLRAVCGAWWDQCPWDGQCWHLVLAGNEGICPKITGGFGLGATLKVI